jgi:hypothetical protein
MRERSFGCHYRYRAIRSKYRGHQTKSKTVEHSFDYVDYRGWLRTSDILVRFGIKNHDRLCSPVERSELRFLLVKRRLLADACDPSLNIMPKSEKAVK